MSLVVMQKAFMPCVSGLARSDATRSAYLESYHPVVGLIQDGTRYDLSRYVQYGSVHISQHLNADIDTASLTLLPTLHDSAVPLPKARAQIEIAMGNPSAVTFAGEIMTMQESRVPMMAGLVRDHRPFIDLTCTDYLDVFDAAMVTDLWPAQSATTTIIDLVTRYTRGGVLAKPFGTAFVEPNMPSLPALEAVNERPSTVLQRIVNLAASKAGSTTAGFYIGTDRQVHAWTEIDPARPSFPQILEESLDTLKSFRRVTDGAQQRTRVFVEGARTETLMALTALPTPEAVGAVGYFNVPIADGGFLPHTFPFVRRQGHNPAAGGWYDYPQYLVRIGTQLVAYGEASVFPRPASGNYPSVTLLQAFTAQPSGTYPLYTSAFPSEWPLYREGDPSNTGWMGFVKMGEQLFLVQRMTPASGGGDGFFVGLYGTSRPQYAMPVGSLITPVPAALLRCFVLTRYSEAENPSHLVAHAVQYQGFGRYYGPLKAEPVGAPVVLVDLAQSTIQVANSIAVLEGGDGWHEHTVQDGRFHYDAAGQRALAEVANFEQPTVAYEWETEDLNAAPGRLQEIFLSEGPDDIHDEVTITDVEITWPVENRPRRSCRAATTRAIQVLDAWLTDTK